MNHTASVLQEMGLGPMWIRRDLLLSSQEEPEVVTATAARTPATPQDQPAAPPVQVAAPAQVAPRAPLVPPMPVSKMTEPVRVAPPAVPAAPPAAPAGRQSLPEDGWDMGPPPWLDEDGGACMPDIVPFDDEVARPARLDATTMDWSQLKAAVADCRQCGLCNGRNKTVFGVGDENARWLFVGEGPGRNEDLQGEPFVGKAGKLLDSMLHALRLRRGEDVYIANIVKCRPVGDNGFDRKPTPEEAGACLPYLQRQIALVKPTVIVALGQTAAWALLGESPDMAVGRLRGRVHAYNGIPVVVTYHPSYLLRDNGRMDRAKAWADLCMARDALTRA